jgi:plasmid stabilization system protein ParE
VARVEFAERVALDIERIVEHLQAHEAADIEARLDDIFDACSVLERHPLIGRRCDGGLRELVIAGARAMRCITSMLSPTRLRWP